MKYGYELILVVDGTLNDEDSIKIFDKYKTQIEQDGGKIELAESWERKKLAYPIKKKLFGFYYVFYFSGPATLKPALERQLSYEEFVLRFMFLKAKDLTEEANFFKTLKADPKVHANLYTDLQKGDT